jgi:hypothetical protein
MGPSAMLQLFEASNMWHLDHRNIESDGQGLAEAFFLVPTPVHADTECSLARSWTPETYPRGRYKPKLSCICLPNSDVRFTFSMRWENESSETRGSRRGPPKGLDRQEQRQHARQPFFEEHSPIKGYITYIVLRG